MANSKYANQTLRDKRGKTIDVQVEFTETEIVARVQGQPVATITCENGKAHVVTQPPVPAMPDRISAKDKRDNVSDQE